ncbi:MAG TPA: neutral zinc metallopeptidase [Polyangiaceae bacterium]|nr:neutral zinc metallopeptidase [Polyangiaceae bacterium]
MKWQRGYRSSDVVDRRGATGLGSGLLGPFVAIGSKFGIVGILAAVGLYFAGRAFLGGEIPLSGTSTSAEERGATAAPDELTSFVSFVFDDAQNVWEKKLAGRGRGYERAKLVLFNDQTSSACGYGSAAVGPFYCPADQRVYIDLDFYRGLERRFGAPGDFAQAYVIAHEVGHHVQGLLGTGPRTAEGARRRRDSRSAESVQFELQADCLAGVWANSTQRRELLEGGDIDEALGAAAAIGDDRLQRQSKETVNPETFTHGSSEQRVRWFRRGLASGNIAACDTFSEKAL